MIFLHSIFLKQSEVLTQGNFRFSQTIHVDNVQSIHSVESQQQFVVVGSTPGHVQEVGHDDDGANGRVDEQGGADPRGPDRHG